MNEIPIRLNTEHIGADQKEMKLGWVIHEIPPDMTEDEYYKEKLSEEEYKEWKFKNDEKRLEEIDFADSYRDDGYGGASGKTVTDKSICGSFGVIEIAQELYGQPWNNLALNYILAFDPIRIRVTSGFVHADACTGRITVVLEQDDRTISHIYKEVMFGSIGGVNSGQLKSALKHQKENGSLDGYKHYRGGFSIINNYAISRIDMGEVDES